MDMRELGKRLREARRARGLTQAEVARHAALSRDTVGAIERGVVPDIGVRKLMRLALALGLELDLKAVRALTLDDFRGQFRNGRFDPNSSGPGCSGPGCG